MIERNPLYALSFLYYTSFVMSFIRDAAFIESSTLRHHNYTNGERLSGLSKIVVTSPPWAKDEPESSLSDNFSPGADRSPRPSERHYVAPETSDNYNRWRFALPRPRPKLMKRQWSTDSLRLSSQSERGTPTRDKRSQQESSRRSRTRWPTSRKRFLSEKQNSHGIVAASLPRASHSETLQSEIPYPSPRLPTSLSHNNTPGWGSPWSPRSPRVFERVAADDRDLDQEKGHSIDNNDALRTEEPSIADLDSLNLWDKRRKNLRSFLLHDTYVPLFSRIANITFTTVTLALAIRIRIVEQENHIRGAVGISPVLAIIFSPLTLVHVMIAIYLEYFGRPLGLWRTSAKLAHTLSEVVFICAWSAELALCFDNYITSPLNCAPRSTIKWYSELPYSDPLGNNTAGGAARDTHLLCAHQRDLISVVVVALLLYVTNLVISLFRIFEKLKVHQGLGL